MTGIEKRLGQGFAVLAFITWLLLIFGSTVRVNGAGLSCPDWPLCFGQIVPQFDMRVFLEWGHRVLAGTISVVFLLLGGGVLARKELRRRFALQLVLMVVVLTTQIVLGKFTVLAGLAYWSVTLHLLCGNLFMALMIGMALRLLGNFSTVPAPRNARPFAIIFAASVAGQLALGGLVSSNYAGLACTEWPTCNGGVWFPTFDGIVGLQLFHRWGASVVTLLALGLAYATRRDAAQAGVRLVLGIVLLQGAFGVINVLTAMPVELAILHAATAHALVAATTLIVTGLFARPRA